MGKPFYEVTVGNIGIVYAGTKGFDAYVVFNTYVGKSKRNEGKGAGESVFLWKDGKPIKEFVGSLAQGGID